jgi:hypothetical protein
LSACWRRSPGAAESRCASRARKRANSPTAARRPARPGEAWGVDMAAARIVVWAARR